MKRSGKAAWTLADYERCKRAEQRRAERQGNARASKQPRRVADLTEKQNHSADAGKKVAPAKIDISTAPSGMDLAVQRWRGKNG